jgi:hypothetical protein
MGGLFNSTVLDVAVGLIFVYLLLGILCTTVNEWLSAVMSTRSKTLRQGIHGLLDGQTLGNASFLERFYLHPLISGMMRDGSHPSYIPSRAFSSAVIDLVTPAVSGPITTAELVSGINSLPDGDVKKALVALMSNVDGDLEKAKHNIEHWFDDSMDRVSGWYKRNRQMWTVIIATCLTLGANVDTMRLAKLLWVNPTVRSAVVEQAKHRAEASANGSLNDQETSAVGDMLGWTSSAIPRTGADWAQRLLGWVFTAIAVSLGAPFWFDTLTRFTNLRSAGKKPPKANGQTATP